MIHLSFFLVVNNRSSRIPLHDIFSNSDNIWLIPQWKYGFNGFGIKKITINYSLLSLEEGDVEDGGVKIHKLEHEHFERQTVFVLCLRSMHF